MRLVEVTGGEPLWQSGCRPLLAALCDRGYTVLLETGGSLDIAGVDPRVRRIVDLKPPSSGMERRNLWSNVRHLGAPRDEVKFVLADQRDYEWARAVIRRHDLEQRTHVLLSTVHGSVAPRRWSSGCWRTGSRPGFRFQLHKLVWEPEARGV